MKASEKLLARAVIATEETYRPVITHVEELERQKEIRKSFLPQHRRKAVKWIVGTILTEIALVAFVGLWLIAGRHEIAIPISAVISLLVLIYGVGTAMEPLTETKKRIREIEQETIGYESSLPKGELPILKDFLSRAFGRYGTSRLDKAVDAVNSARASVISITAAIDTVVAAKLISGEEAECMQCGVESALESTEKAGEALRAFNGRIVISSKRLRSSWKTTAQQDADGALNDRCFANKEVGARVTAEMLQNEDTCAAILRGLDALDEIAACGSPVKFKQLNGFGRLQEITKDIKACFDVFYTK